MHKDRIYNFTHSHFICVPSFPVSSALGKLSLCPTPISLWPGLCWRPCSPSSVAVLVLSLSPLLGAEFLGTIVHLHHISPATRYPCPKCTLRTLIHVRTPSHWLCAYDMGQQSVVHQALKMRPKCLKV